MTKVLCCLFWLQEAIVSHCFSQSSLGSIQILSDEKAMQLSDITLKHESIFKTQWGHETIET
jgi:hypothetical protein